MIEKNSNLSFKMVAKTISGLEEVLAKELTDIGASEVNILTRGVSFQGDNSILYKSNYLCRTAIRIIVPLIEFKAKNHDDIYREVKKFKWEDYFTTEETISIDAVLSTSYFDHSHYTALKTKDAIVDRFREKEGKRPSVDIKSSDIRINLYIRDDVCTLSLDSSGESLHKRGCRVEQGLAPISEVLAAGMISLSGWKADCHFVDPMCGSGTILIEAAMYAYNIPAGFFRKRYSFMNWKNFCKETWDKVVDEGIASFREFEYDIIGSDISAPVIIAARTNIEKAKLRGDIILTEKPFDRFRPPTGPGIMIMNPPYGERLSNDDPIEFHKYIGDTLKNKYKGYSAWIISSDLQSVKFIGLKPSRKIKLYNGPLECRFLRFDIYEGSKKRRIDRRET